MKKFIFLMFWLLINNNLFAGEINIYYPDSRQELCRTTPLVVKWTGSAVDVNVGIKKESDAEYKSVYHYQINNNTFIWTVNDAEYLNVPLSVRVSDLSDPNIFDEYHGVTVYGETAILQQTQSVQVCSGEEIYMQVDALGYNLSYQWYKDDKPIEGAVSSVLRYSNADYSYTGTYVCKIISNSPCGTMQSKPISVYVATPTKFITSPEEVFWEYNKSATMTASLHANNEPEINNVKFRWFKDTVIYTFKPPKTFIPDTIMLELKESKKYIGTNSQDLEITRLVWNDRTTYYCVADGLCGSDTVSCVIGDESRFEILRDAPDFFGCEGLDVTFKAKVITNVKGTFTYQWYKTGFKKLIESDKYIGTKTLELTIKNANRKEDWYNYYVLVTWVEKKVSKRSEPFVCNPEFLPEIVSQQHYWVMKSRYRSYMFNSAFLRIDVYNYTPCFYEWFKDDKIVSSGYDNKWKSDYRGGGDSAKNVGWYSCKISNNCGSIWSDSIYISFDYDDTVACIGNDFSFRTDDFGTPFVYKWENEGQILTDNEKIKNSNTHNLIIKDFQESDEGIYIFTAINKYTKNPLAQGQFNFIAGKAPFIVKDLPDKIENTDEYMPQAYITVNSKARGLYYTLYIDNEKFEEDEYLPKNKNNEFRLVLGGDKSNLKPGVYQYHFRNQCGEVWSNKMKVTNTAYIPGGIVLIGDEDTPSSIIPDGENSKFEIYPNPASDYIEINIHNGASPIASGKVQIFNTLDIDVSPAGGGMGGVDGGGFRIDISHLPSGMYFIKIGNNIEKFMKM